MVTPGASAGGFADADFRAARVVIGRDGIVAGIVPIAAPFVDVIAEVVEAEGIWRVEGDWLGAIEPPRRVIGKRLRRVVAPGKIFLLEVAAGGALPLGFGGKAVGAGGLGGEPVAIIVSVKPGDACYGLLRMVEIGIGPEGRSGGRRGAEEVGVFGVGDLRGG